MGAVRLVGSIQITRVLGQILQVALKLNKKNVLHVRDPGDVEPVEKLNKMATMMSKEAILESMRFDREWLYAGNVMDTGFL